MIPVRLTIAPRLVPRGFAAWVPWRRLIVVRSAADLTERLVAHELQHVLQWERLGVLAFLPAYALGWARAGFSYANNPLEVEARAAERDPHMLTWARELIEGAP